MVSGVAFLLLCLAACWTEVSCFSEDYSWEVAGSLPQDAVAGGYDLSCGGWLYVGRVPYRGNYIPANICPSRGIAYFGHNGNEHSSAYFEVLRSSNVYWTPGWMGILPRTILAGTTKENEKLYVGRAELNGTLMIGKVKIGEDKVTIPFGGKEIQIINHSILVLD